MAYEVLARKWRPQTFEDVVGQEPVIQTLRNALRTGRIAHAYLFVGPRGTGKTTLARLFAKALNCEKGTGPEPCGVCTSCTEIAAGNALDVLEIDGASNTGVDNVRDLRESVKYAPARGPFRIYIIDEVHMLSTSAFNALLKTLEEPPGHAKFLFATTEVQKIPATVLSRCQRFDLRRIPTAVIVTQLARIAKKEKIKIEPDALLAIARGSEGGLRDATSALDQLVSFRGASIQEEDVLSVFGLVARSAIEALARATLEGDIAAVVRIVEELDAAGKDVQRILVDLLEHFRNLLVFVSVGGKGLGAGVTEDQARTLDEQSSLAQVDRMLDIADHLVAADQQLRYALSRKTLLETVLIRCARAAKAPSLDELIRRIEALRAGVGEGGAAPPGAAPAGAAATSHQPEGDGDSGSRPVPVAKPVTRDPDRDLQRVLEAWSGVVSHVRTHVVSARAALSDLRPLRVEEDVVVLGLDREFESELAELHGGRIETALPNALSRALDRRVGFRIELTDGLPRPARTGNRATGAEPPSPQTPEPPAAGAGEDSTVADDSGAVAPKPDGRTAGASRNWAEEPAVQEALAVFGGRVIDVRE